MENKVAGFLPQVSWLCLWLRVNVLVVLIRSLCSTVIDEREKLGWINNKTNDRPLILFDITRPLQPHNRGVIIQTWEVKDFPSAHSVHSVRSFSVYVWPAALNNHFPLAGHIDAIRSICWTAGPEVMKTSSEREGCLLLSHSQDQIFHLEFSEARRWLSLDRAQTMLYLWKKKKQRLEKWQSWLWCPARNIITRLDAMNYLIPLQNAINLPDDRRRHQGPPTLMKYIFHWDPVCVKKKPQNTVNRAPRSKYDTKVALEDVTRTIAVNTPLSENGRYDVAAVISMIVEDTQESALEQLLFLHMQGEVSAIPSRPVIVCSAVRCECERRPGRTAAAYACFGSFSCLSVCLTGWLLIIFGCI